MLHIALQAGAAVRRLGMMRRFLLAALPWPWQCRRLVLPAAAFLRIGGSGRCSSLANLAPAAAQPPPRRGGG